MSKRTWTIRSRETGEIATEMDVTGKSERELARVFDGMVMRVDFERFELVDSAYDDRDEATP